MHQEVKNAFIAAFKINRTSIRWNSCKRATTYMQSHIYPAIATYMNLDFEYEYDKITNEKIDAVFYKKGEEGNKPHIDSILIGMEHENIAGTIKTELEHLANAAYPLSVLITYTWDGDERDAQERMKVHEGYIITEKTKPFLDNIPKILIIISNVAPINPENYQTDMEVKWDYYLYDKNSGRLQLV